MKFKSNADKENISKFLYLAYQIVPEIIKDILEKAGYKIKKTGEGINVRFIIKVHDYEAVLQLHNLLLEIVTRNRDAVCLEFDTRIKDKDFFITKTMNTIESKLKILFTLNKSKNIDRALEKIKKFSGYERLAMIRVNREKIDKEKREKEKS